jgi:hypothetical protein
MYMAIKHTLFKVKAMHRTTIMLPEDLKSQAIEYASECGLSLGEIIRESLENWLKNRKQRSSNDPLFHDVPVYDGPVPDDYSINHDRYLYGDKSDFH